MEFLFLIFCNSGYHYKHIKLAYDHVQVVWLTLLPFMWEGPNPCLAQRLDILRSVCGFFTQPFKTYWVSTSDAFLDMSFHFFSSSLFSNPVTCDSVYTQAVENT